MSHPTAAFVPHLRGFFRVVERPSLPPTVIGPLVTAAYLAVMIPLFNLVGLFDGVRVDGVPFWFHEHARLEVWYAGFLGFLAFAVGHFFRGCARDLEKLRPALRPERSFEALRDEILSIDRRRFWIAGGIGIAAGIGTSVSAISAIPFELRMWLRCCSRAIALC